MLLSVVVMGTDGSYVPISRVTYAVCLGGLWLQGLLVTFGARWMGKLQSVFVTANILLVLVTIIALPVGRRGELNTGRYIFGHMENLTGWQSQGWVFFLAWLSPMWTVGEYLYVSAYS